MSNPEPRLSTLRAAVLMFTGGGITPVKDWQEVQDDGENWIEADRGCLYTRFYATVRRFTFHSKPAAGNAQIGVIADDISA